MQDTAPASKTQKPAGDCAQSEKQREKEPREREREHVPLNGVTSLNKRLNIRAKKSKKF